MKKENISILRADIKSLRRARTVIKELLLNFPDDARNLEHQEEFIQLANARICLDKTITRMQHYLEKVTNP